MCHKFEIAGIFFDNLREMITRTKLDYINRIFDECLSEDGESLELKAKFIGDEGLEALMQVERPLEEVENLDLTRNQITKKGLPVLAESNRFPKLKRLYLGENNIGDKGAIALSIANFAPQLVNLDLRFNNIEEEGGLALAQGQFKKLQIFILQDNPTGDATLMAMAKHPGFAHVRKLNIYRTKVTDKGIKILAKSKVFKKVKHLNLARNVLRYDAAHYLANSKTLTNIETLLMFDTFIGDKGVDELLKSESLTKLKTLRLT